MQSDARDGRQDARHCLGMAREAELTERTVVLVAPEMVAAIDNYRKRGDAIRHAARRFVSWSRKGYGRSRSATERAADWPRRWR
jgi:hypothetical protein